MVPDIGEGVSLDALTLADDGRLALPTSEEDWANWVNASDTRKHALDDPLLDWLDLYGEERGFQRDIELPEYDARTDFAAFLRGKGLAFEAAVVNYLETLTSVVTIAEHPTEVRELEKAKETFAAMERGEKVIRRGVLRDADARTYGSPDLLVRSDELLRLFPDALDINEASIAAPDLAGARWHYRIVDLLFMTLHLLRTGELRHGDREWARRVESHVCNRALGRLQGYLPPATYLIGRGWEQRQGGESRRGTSCVERLARLSEDHHLPGGRSVLGAAEGACGWLRRVRREGNAWDVFPQPTVDELRPNIRNDQDFAWHAAKLRIAEELQELTLCWQVGIDARRVANQSGILRWADPTCTAEELFVSEARSPILQAILDVNRAIESQPVLPARIRSAEEEWREEPSLEFYVDFDTVENLDDDFSRIPERGGQPLIFMIGCGHVENGEWEWTCFIADALSEPCEAEMIDAWFDHMEGVRRRLDPDGEEPRLFHYSHHEHSRLDSAYNSARNRHPEKEWPTPRWFDFLSGVILTEPVVVRGALNFRLKTVANAMHAHGLIETRWQDGPADGRGAMVGAWACATEASRRGRRLAEIELMREIARYNEVDCKVLMEIVRYLRNHH